MKRALLVDDDEDFCSHLAETLDRCVQNCCIITARNGKEAARIMAVTPVDFIITDLNMPRMDGYGFISHARKNFPDIPILAMTGTKTPEVEKRLRTLGVARCIEKPFDVKEIVPLILSELQGKISSDSTQPGPGFT